MGLLFGCLLLRLVLIEGEIHMHFVCRGENNYFTSAAFTQVLFKVAIFVYAYPKRIFQDAT